MGWPHLETSVCYSATQDKAEGTVPCVADHWEKYKSPEPQVYRQVACAGVVELSYCEVAQVIRNKAIVCFNIKPQIYIFITWLSTWVYIIKSSFI